MKKIEIESEIYEENKVYPKLLQKSGASHTLNNIQSSENVCNLHSP